jgi:L-aspartate oxidase
MTGTSRRLRPGAGAMPAKLPQVASLRDGAARGKYAGPVMANHSSDVLVIGSGIAGLSFALEAARNADVTIVTKRSPEVGSTWLAQGGISAAVGGDDSIDLHVQDTLLAGDGLCDEAVVREVCGQGPRVVETLRRLGASFGDADSPALGREGGHSRRRIVHAHDTTGLEIEMALLAAVSRHGRIRMLPDHFAVDMILEPRWKSGLPDPPRCRGAWVLEARTGEIHAFAARATVLATGGSGKVYLYTTNPDVATGDGLAIAYRAGCRVSNLEFYQFHPTCLFHPHAKSFLISEAVRGEGGVLIGPDGRRIMEGVHPQGDLAPRDVVAREIDRTMKERGVECVHLDITHRDPDFLRRRFPGIHGRCLELGIDISQQPIPVVPAAHYQCGGVVTDLDGRTDLPGLFAIGEVTCTGMHGANRLASNSLLEAAAMGSRAAAAAARSLTAWNGSQRWQDVPAWEKGLAIASDETVVVTHAWDEIRRFMWNYVGIFRSDSRLERARRRIELTESEIREYYWKFIVTPDLLELRNLAIVARLVIESALWRKESRGLHYTTTWPQKDEAHRIPSMLRRRGTGESPEILSSIR